MNSSTPPRRFNPQPVETTSTSSQKPRRFAAEPVETTKSSRRNAPEPAEPTASESDAKQHAEQKDARAEHKEVIEGRSSTPRRRFAPEPVETTTKSNRKRINNDVDEGRDVTAQNTDEGDETSKKPARRKFLPEPVEVTSKSHRAANNKSNDEDLPLLSRDMSGDERKPPESRTPRRFAAEPIETTSKSYRKGNSSDKEKTLRPDDFKEGDKQPERKPTRKFKVEMVETTSRSRRSGDEGPTMLLSDRTNASPDDPTPKNSTLRPGPSPLPPANTPVLSANEVYQLKPPPLRQSSLHPHHNTPRANTRTHAFKVPSLDDIESSESDESKPPSLSRTKSDTSEQSVGSEAHTYQHPARRRESVDDKFSGYLLALAARTAEKQLREQAAAAFPNDDSHSPVAHYMNTEESDDEEVMPDPTRRDSSDGMSQLREMRRHGEKVYQENQKRKQMERKKTAAFNVEFDSEAQQDAWDTPKAPKHLIGGRQNDPDLRQMRKAAAPPMLGDDINFPRCPSPEHARFDVTQGAEFLKNYLQDNSPQQQGGLWGQVRPPSEASSTPSGSRSPLAESQSSNRGGGGAAATGGGAGLWGGFCTGNNAKVEAPSGLYTPIRTPAATPRLEREDPFSSHLPSMMEIDSTASASAAARRQPYPPSPPPSNSSSTQLHSLNSRLEVEARLDTEFPDVFITQVYNYLSLGYPALAQKFDHELSKISGVAVDELRQDDMLVEARGYIRLGDDELVATALAQHVGSGETKAGNIAEEVISEDMCGRWRALKLYVREWGRQQLVKPGGLGPVEGRQEDPLRAWGMPARKGSWGL